MVASWLVTVLCNYALGQQSCVSNALLGLPTFAPLMLPVKGLMGEGVCSRTQGAFRPTDLREGLASAWMGP